MQEQLKKVLNEHGAKLIDLFREWDDDGNGAVDKHEFRKAIAALGYDAPKSQIDALFNSMDEDGSGWIEYHELKDALSDKGIAEPTRIWPRTRRRALVGQRTWPDRARLTLQQV